jgi:hypothetical protein
MTSPKRREGGSASSSPEVLEKFADTGMTNTVPVAFETPKAIPGDDV